MNKEARIKLTKYNTSFKALDETYRGVAKLFGMGECTFWIIYTLRMEPAPLTQRDICKLQYQPKQTVNSALKKMEADGLIAFSQDKNRRNKNISLTEKGILFAKKTVDKFCDAEADALLSMSSKEQDEISNLLFKYNSFLNEKIKELDKKISD